VNRFCLAYCELGQFSLFVYLLFVVSILDRELPLLSGCNVTWFCCIKILDSGWVRPYFTGYILLTSVNLIQWPQMAQYPVKLKFESMEEYVQRPHNRFRILNANLPPRAPCPLLDRTDSMYNTFLF